MVIFLPGVPAEFQHFVYKDIIPLLSKKYPDERSEFRQQCYFMNLGESNINQSIVELMEKYPELSFGIYPDLGLLSVHLISNFATVEENKAFQAPIKQELIAKFKDKFYSDTEISLAKVVCGLCKKNNLKVSLNEHSPYLSLRSQLGPALDSTSGSLKLEVSGIPDLEKEEDIYESKITIAISMAGKSSLSEQYDIRGNRKMFAARSEHAALAEMFKFLTN